MADKNIIIGRVINVTGMIGVVAGKPSYSLSYCSYFGVALALTFQTRFTGFGSWIAILKASIRRMSRRQKSNRLQRMSASTAVLPAREP
jgi:hypothetical protein